MYRIQIHKSVQSCVLLLLAAAALFSQTIWYENEHGIRSIYPIDTTGGIYSTDVNSPDDTFNVAKLTSTTTGNASITYKLSNPITSLSDLTINLAIYIDKASSQLNEHSCTVSVALNKAEATPLAVQNSIEAGEEWTELGFNFSDKELPDEILTTGGYDAITITVSSGITCYIKSISGTQIQSPAKVLGGNWGVTFPVSPAKGSDYDYAAGAREIVTELNTIGHVITNFTGFAHGQYFTLHHNPNVDIAAEIHPSSVPGEENDHVMEEVLSIFRAAGIKTILYMALDGYHNFNATDEQKAAWENYYTTKFNGDEYAAYKDLMMGFVSRTKDMCDGYWLDHVTAIPGGGKDNLDDFVASIREIHPEAMISANDTKAWLTTGPQQWVKVDSDGLDDTDTTDYLIVTHESRNYRSDFTSGHVTPIGQGAPVNSWAYEEFTIPNMFENPWSTYNGFTSMKHAWFPVRERWHVPQKELVQEVEQAYRFVRRVTDGGAAITWANTAEYRKWENPGHMMPDEMEMMKEINRRMSQSSKPDYEPYVRPEGAYLVGEEPVFISSEPIKATLKPVLVSFRNNTIHFNQNFARISIYTANGRRVAEVNRVANEVELSAISKGVYFVNVEFTTGVKQNFRCIFR